MRLYLDTSALVKLYVDEPGTPLVRKRVAEAQLVATATLAYVEARAAFARRYRERSFSGAEYRRIVRDLDRDWGHYLLLEVTEPLIREAAALAETHRLRAYDAVHLASARVLKRRLGATVLFASWDTDLESAAGREGLEPVGVGVGDG